MPKRQNKKGADDEQSKSPNKRVRITPGNASTTEDPPASCGLKNTLHGDVFQLKLLMLFLIRGIGAGSQFRLGTEMPGMGGKFDDLIFKFKKFNNISEANSSIDEQTESYRFLQAKHKQNEGKEKITAADLLNDNNGDFSLPKYFRSYFRDVINPTDKRLAQNVNDCIICTNIGFDSEIELRKSGIELIPLDDYDPILFFDKISDEKMSARYRLNKTDELRRKMAGWSEVHLLAKTLLDYATKDKKLALNSDVFKSYHLALVSEKVIHREKKGDGAFSGKLDENFLNGTNLTENIKEFRKFLSDYTFEQNKNKKSGDSDEDREIVFKKFWKSKSFKLSESFGSKDDNKPPGEITKSLECAINEDINSFLDKLIFAVHSPNEVELDNILKNEVRKYYELHENDFQSDFIFRNMLDWFKKKESTFMSSEEGEKIFKEGKKKLKSLRVTANSIDYQKKLKEVLDFNDEAIEVMKEKLIQLLTSSDKIERIVTKLPKRTAVKVIAALGKLKSEQLTINNQVPKEYFQCEDSYLMTSISNFQKNISKFKKALESEHSHNLLVVVCKGNATEDEESYQKMVKKMQNKTIIITGPGGTGVEDKLNFGDLSEKSKRALLQKKILFQGKLQSVESLIQSGDRIEFNPENVIDLESMEELIQKELAEIPSFISSRIENLLYIQRRLTPSFSLDDQFWNEVAKKLGKNSIEQLKTECRVNLKGEIQWNVEIAEKSKIWNEMNLILEKINSSIGPSPSCSSISENDLLIDFNHQDKLPRVVIISGVAGSGKSSSLSHYYDEMKERTPGYWVIMINLSDHSEAFSKLEYRSTDKETAINFLLDLSVVVGKSPFARSLLKNRLETGERIVIMLDGFDESHYQEIVIQLIQAFKQIKSVQLIVTTRPHMAGHLQLKLSQLAYNLDNFSKQDQINYLTSFWKSDLEVVKQFADSFIDLTSKILKDQERAFIGIPLQCRILAECFESQVEKANSQQEFHSLLTEINGLNLNLANLYRRLIIKKRDIYWEEKVKAQPHNPLMDSLIKKDINNLKCYLVQLAVKTIVSNKEDVDVLLGKEASQPSFESEAKLEENEEKQISGCVRFGLLNINTENKVQFLHRTYAEYFMADYLYHGILLDEKCHNKLLENKCASKFMVNKILAIKQYEGVQTFFDSILKELVADDEEWRNRIVQRCLPNRLNKFASNLFTQFLRQSPPFHAFGTDLMKIKSYFVNALYFSLANGKGNIFEFLCDCLDATFDKKEVQRAMLNSFGNSYCYFSLKFFRGKESRLFKRFINYFDSCQFAPDLSSKLTWYSCGLPPCDLKYSQWNDEEQQKVISYLLQFFANQREAFEMYFNPKREIHIVPMITFLIFNENYDSQLKLFLELLSRSPAYSDDSKFAKLLEKAFYSKKHFVCGRIEKVFLILGKLNRENLLTQLYDTVLAVEPKAFQNICHLSHPLDEIGPISTNLNQLLERDSYRMTRLHRAAFYGDKEDAEKILEKIHLNIDQGNDTEQVVKVLLARDEYGFTPFYVAAALGKERIFRTFLAFLSKQVVAGKVPLEKDLIDLKGFIHCALWNAMESENVDMFKLILNAVKRELGQSDLIALLKTDRATKSDFPYFARCKTKKLFNAMAKIIVIYDNFMDYTDLYDLVFYSNSTRRTLQYIDKDNLQGLLSLKGVDDFTKRVLDNKISLLSNAFQLLSNYVLKHFTEEQLDQFVQIITSKNNPIKIRSNNTITVDSARVEEWADTFIHEGWTVNELVFDDEGNGTTSIYAERIVPICYWREFIKSALTGHYDDRGFVSHQDAHCIFDCLKYAGDFSAKKLFLHEEEDISRMIQSSQTIVKLMLNHLSKESQEEVKHHWKNNAPPMSTFFDLTSTQTPISRIRFARCCSDILRFYLNYGSEIHLNEFVNVVTFLKNIGEVNFSVWSYVFENCDKEETNEILTLVVEKEDVLGGDAIKKLFLHEIDQVPFIIKAVSWGEDVEARLEILPKEIKGEIQQFIEQNAPEFLEKAFRDLKTFFHTLVDTERHSWRKHYNKLNTFTFFLNYHSDKSQLEQLVQYIMSSVDGGNTRSIWAELLIQDCEDHKTEDITKMDKFLECVSKKIDSNAVKELVLHKDGEKSVIFYPALRGEEKLLETMLNYLSTKDRKKIQRQVDKYLDETFKIPPGIG